MGRLAAIAAALIAAAACFAQEPPAPRWCALAAFRADGGGQAAADVASAAAAWESAGGGEGLPDAALARAGRFRDLPYPAAVADAFARAMVPVPAPRLPAPDAGRDGFAAWLPAAFRDGTDAPFAAAMAALGNPAFAKRDGTPKPRALERALSDASASAALWLEPDAPRGGRFERGMRAWAAFRAGREGGPSLPPVARDELRAALAWCSARSLGRPADRESLTVLAVAWMARERPRDLSAVPTLEEASFRDAAKLSAAAEAAAGKERFAALMAAALPRGCPEGGPAHRAAALELLDESPEGAWGVPADVRREVRRASRSSSWPLVDARAALEALDGIPGLAEAPGTPGRAGDEEAVAAAFREAPLPVRSWRTVHRAQTDAAAVRRLNVAISEAMALYDRWASAPEGPGKKDLAAQVKAAGERLGNALDRDGAALPPETAAKGRDVASLLAAKFGK